MDVPSLYEIYAIILFGACAFFLLCRLVKLLSHSVAPIWRVARSVAHKMQFHRLVRRHSLVGPFYTYKVLACAAVVALNAAILSLQITKTETSTFSMHLTTLSDAAARAKYLALLNLTVIYLSPHHYGVADVFGVSLRLFQQVHRVAGLLSLSQILFSIIVPLVDARGSATGTDDGRIGLMTIACVATLTASSLVKPFAYEVFLKMHQISAAVLAYLLLSQVLAYSSFSKLPLYIYGALSALLNVFFVCRYGYHNFAGWKAPELVYSQIAASRVHEGRWLHLELKVPRRVHVKPGQYISVWIPGVQLLSTHPFAVVATTESEGTVFHVYLYPENGVTKTLISPFLPSATTADKPRTELTPDELEKQKQTCEVRWSQDGRQVIQTKQTVDQEKFRPRFALFTGPHGRSVNPRQFETVVLVASGFGYWCLDGYLDDMLRTERAGASIRRIVLVYKGKPPLMIENAIKQRLRVDKKNSDDGSDDGADGGSDDSMKLRVRVLFFPADNRKEAARDDRQFRDMDELGKLKKFKTAGAAEMSNATVIGAKIVRKGRYYFLPKPPPLKNVVEDPYGFEQKVNLTVGQSSFDHGSVDDSKTLILVSAEKQLVDELKQAVTTSKKTLHLHVLDFVPQKCLEHDSDEFGVRRV